jgi:hypothetical protein
MGFLVALASFTIVGNTWGCGVMVSMAGATRCALRVGAAQLVTV